MPTFTNKATLSYKGRSVDSNTVTGNITELLTVSKTALSDSYGADSKLTYVVSLVNSGSTAYTDLTVTDNLGGYQFENGTVYSLSYVDTSLLYLINGIPQSDPAVVAGPPLTVSGISVPAGGNATLIYEATVNEFAPLDAEGVITNTVTVSGANLPEDLVADETVSVAPSPELTITKSLFPLTVTDNGELTYTFVIRNSGNTAAVATDNAVVTDLFDPILTITSVTLDDAPLSVGTGYFYDTSTGLFETVAGVITVPAATFIRNGDGSVTVVPGSTTLTVSGRI